MQSEFNSEAQSFRVFKSREANWFWSHGLEPERLAEPCSLHPASLGRYNCSECFPNSFRCHSSLGRSCLSWVGCTLGGSKPTVFPGDSVIKNPLANAGDQRHGFDSWVGKTPWRRKWHPKYFCLNDPMDTGAWWAIVCGVAKSRTRFSS